MSSLYKAKTHEVVCIHLHTQITYQPHGCKGKARRVPSLRFALPVGEWQQVVTLERQSQQQNPPHPTHCFS